MSVRATRLFLFAALCISVTACSSRMAGFTDAANALMNGDKDVSATTALRSDISYLRVASAGRISLLALGYIDPHPLGFIHVWYSSQGEVLRLQNGHVVGLTGTPVEWRQVNLSGMPAWPPIAQPGQYTRTKDLMPGYRFGMTDQLVISNTPEPRESNLIKSSGNQQVRWYEIQEVRQNIPVARIAVADIRGSQTAIYGEQCLTSTFCLTWQSWPPQASQQ